METNSVLNKYRRVLSTASRGYGVSTCKNLLYAMKELHSESRKIGWNLKKAPAHSETSHEMTAAPKELQRGEGLRSTSQ